MQPAFVDSSGLHRGRGHAHAGQQVRRLPLQHLSQYHKHSHFDYVRGNYFGLPDDGNNGRLLRTQDLRDNGFAGDHFGHCLGPAGQKPLPGGGGPAARRVRSVNRARNQLQHNFIDRAGRLPRVVDGGAAGVLQHGPSHGRRLLLLAEGLGTDIRLLLYHPHGCFPGSLRNPGSGNAYSAGHPALSLIGPKVVPVDCQGKWPLGMSLDAAGHRRAQGQGVGARILESGCLQVHPARHLPLLFSALDKCDPDNRAFLGEFPVFRAEPDAGPVLAEYLHQRSGVRGGQPGGHGIHVLLHQPIPQKSCGGGHLHHRAYLLFGADMVVPAEGGSAVAGPLEQHRHPGGHLRDNLQHNDRVDLLLSLRDRTLSDAVESDRHQPSQHVLGHQPRSGLLHHQRRHHLGLFSYDRLLHLRYR